MSRVKGVKIGRIIRGHWVFTGAHHVLVDLAGGWVPGLIVLHVAVVGVVGSVADPPAVVWHQDGCVCDVTDEVIQLLVVRETAVATATPKKSRLSIHGWNDDIYGITLAQISSNIYRLSVQW